MTGEKIYCKSSFVEHFLVLNMRDCYTCSFKEFLPFASDIYFFSTFKDFAREAA